MAVAEKARKALGMEPTPVPVPTDIEQRMKRGRDVMLKDASHRRLCWRFWRGGKDGQYWYLNEHGTLRSQDTVTKADGAGKPPHRVRQTRNHIHGIVEDKVSTATKRTPSYSVIPSTTDAKDAGAAELSGKVAVYGYDKWGVRRARVKVVTDAFVCGEGFAYPYFDPNVGPYRPVKGDDGETRWVGAGEVKIHVLDANQVFWEEGCDFDDSPWHAIERARPVDEVKQTPGFLGGELKPDASTSDNPTERKGEHLILVTEYFERPCPKYPMGRKLTIANDRQITKAEDYPVRDPDGEVVDEPVLHRLSYTIDPGQDRDRGLVEHLIDAQRTYNDSNNKALEYKNRGLNPQMMAPRGSNVTRRDDTPGATWFYTVVGGQKPEWEKPLQIPRELFEIADRARQDMRDIAADTGDVDAGPDVAARTVQAVMERAQGRWAAFLQDLAEFDSRLMRACLSLVQRHYTERRLIQVRGEMGWEPIRDFLGAQLRGQVDVRVLPESLQPRTRQGIREEIQAFVAMFPGVIEPEVAMAAWHGGLAEKLIESYRQDVQRANSIIQRIKADPEALLNAPLRVDNDGQQVPSWMPRKFDNLRVHKAVFEFWLKSEDYENSAEEVKAMAELYYDGLLALEAQQAADAAAQQSMMAEQLGEQNAARAPAPKSMPSQPAAQTLE